MQPPPDIPFDNRPALHASVVDIRKKRPPPPRFDFDESRSYFRVTLPVQEGFAGLRG